MSDKRPDFPKLISNRQFRDNAENQYDFEKIFRKRTGKEPEKLLMAAIFSDVLHVIRKYGPSRKVYLEAMEWIEETDDDGLFSFENICEVLGFNPNYIRKGVRKFAEKSGRRKRPRMRLIKGGKK